MKTTIALLATLATLAARAQNPDVPAPVKPPTAAIHKLSAGSDWQANEIRIVISYLQSEISKAGLLTLLERDRIQLLFDEIEHSQGGLVNDRDYIKFGQQSGAKYVLVGELSNLLLHEKSVHSPLGGGRTLGLISDATLTMTVRLIDTTRGETDCVLVESATRRYELSKTERMEKDLVRDQLARDAARKIAASMKEAALFKPAAAASNVSANEVTIQLASDPAGAGVSINGVLQGSTPGTFRVPAGPQQVEIEMDGYTAWARKVNCVEGFSFTAKLKEIREPDVVIKKETGRLTKDF